MSKWKTAAWALALYWYMPGLLYFLTGQWM
jgi:hypothetical protein